MPKTITIDNLQAVRLRIEKTGTGTVRVYAEYTLAAGTQAIRAVHQDVTARLSAGRQNDAKVLLDAITQEIAAFELA